MAKIRLEKQSISGAERPTFSLIVPLYNEQERIAESWPALRDFISGYPSGSELLLVDDGSTDHTLDVVRDCLGDDHAGCNVRLLCLPHRGKGAAVRAGLADARASYAGFCDVDLATPLQEVERLLTIATIGPGLVIGSRDVITTTLVVRESSGREMLGKCFNRLVRSTVTPGIYDTQCGAKVAATPIWKQLLPYCKEDGFAFDVELVAIARRVSFAVWEVGVQWSHDSRSRVRPLPDGLAMVSSVPRIWRRTRTVRSRAGTSQIVLDLAAIEAQPGVWAAWHTA